MDYEQKFEDLSSLQKELYKSISGFEYVDNSLEGSFTTNRPYDKDWDLSPWLFLFQFHKDTGYLLCELNHRMTNNRPFGWDFYGNELPYEIIKTIYPIEVNLVFIKEIND